MPAAPGPRARSALAATGLVAAGVALLVGCGRQAASVGGALGVAPSSPGADGRRIDLVVEVRENKTATPTAWTLTCNPTGGNHPNKAAACEALLAAGDDPWAPVATGRGCTEQYGGPRTATVTGIWYGVRVTARFNRSNGCEIARWDALGPLFENGATASEQPGAAGPSVTGEVDGSDPAMVAGTASPGATLPADSPSAAAS